MNSNGECNQSGVAPSCVILLKLITILTCHNSYLNPSPPIFHTFYPQHSGFLCQPFSSSSMLLRMATIAIHVSCQSDIMTTLFCSPVSMSQLTLLPFLIDHNRVHAADVLHAVYYLTSQPIENFRQVPLDLIEQYDELLAAAQSHNFPETPSKVSQVSEDHSEMEEETGFARLRNDIAAIVVAAAAAAQDSERPSGIMGANLTALEVMALYTAAAMHDFQHPGRTNSFLVATNSPLVSVKLRKFNDFISNSLTNGILQGAFIQRSFCAREPSLGCFLGSLPFGT